MKINKIQIGTKIKLLEGVCDAQPRDIGVICAPPSPYTGTIRDCGGDFWAVIHGREFARYCIGFRPTEFKVLRYKEE